MAQTLLELAARLAERDEEVKRLDGELSKVKAERETANQELTARMVDEDMQSFCHRGLGKSFFLTVQRSVSYDREREEEFFQALRDHRWGEIIRPSLNSRTLTAAVTKEMMTEDENGSLSLPGWIEEYVTVFERPKVGMRKA